MITEENIFINEEYYTLLIYRGGPITIRDKFTSLLGALAADAHNFLYIFQSCIFKSRKQNIYTINHTITTNSTNPPYILTESFEGTMKKEISEYSSIPNRIFNTTDIYAFQPDIKTDDYIRANKEIYEWLQREN